LSTLNYREQSALHAYIRVTITNVDTSAGIVDAVDMRIQSYRIPINYYNQGFTAIPAVNEVWVIKKIANSWELYGRYEQGSIGTQLSDMAAGDHRIDTTGVLHLNANSINFSEGSLNETINGSALIYPLNIYPENINNLNQDILIVQSTANTYPQFSLTERVIEGDISLSFGNGTSELDISLYRSGSATLTIDGNVNITGTLSINTSSGLSYTIPSYTPLRSFVPSGASLNEVANVLATLISDLGYNPAAIAPGSPPLPLAGGGNAINQGTAWTINVPISIPSEENLNTDLPTIY